MKSGEGSVVHLGTICLTKLSEEGTNAVLSCFFVLYCTSFRNTGKSFVTYGEHHTWKLLHRLFYLYNSHVLPMS